jgi:hypothetical protein
MKEDEITLILFILQRQVITECDTIVCHITFFRSFFRTLAATQIASLQPNQISQPNNTNDFI